MTHPRCLARALPLALLTAVALAGGCKTDQPAATAAAAKPASDDTAAARPAPATPPPAASAPTRPPALPEPPAAAADDDSRRDFRKRRGAIDSDGDGVISDAERAAAVRNRATAIQTRLDADGDGKLTPAELASARGRMMRFDDPTALDTNHDGDISADELAAGMQARRDQRRADHTGSAAAAPPARP